MPSPRLEADVISLLDAPDADAVGQVIARPRRTAPSASLTAAARRALIALGRLFLPKCPRCGARRTAAGAPPREERDPSVAVRCLTCDYEWVVMPPDALLGP